MLSTSLARLRTLGETHSRLASPPCSSPGVEGTGQSPHPAFACRTCVDGEARAKASDAAPREPVYEVIWLATVPGKRGRGCGAALFYAILDLCASAGGGAVVVTSTLQATCWWLGVGRGEEAGKRPTPQLKRRASDRGSFRASKPGGKRSPGSPSKKKVAHASPTAAGGSPVSGTPVSKKRWQRCRFAMLPVVVQRGKSAADARRKLKEPRWQQRFDRLVGGGGKNGKKAGGIVFAEEPAPEVALAVGSPLPQTRFSPLQTAHIWWLRK